MNEYKYFYCKSWFGAKKRPTEVWGEEEAKKAHEEGKTYTVLVNDIHKPFAIIDVTGGGDFIGVGFLDEYLRESLSYQFEEVESGKLFLSMATHREFDGESDNVLRGHSYVFKQDGKLVIRNQSFKPHKLEELGSSTDVASNYEQVPDFGNYDSLLIVERN